MRYTTFGLIALTSATLSLTACGWIGSRQQSQQANNSCCPNCPCCQNGHRGMVASQDRPDNRRDGGGDRRNDRDDDRREARDRDDDHRGPANRAPRNEERQIRKVIVQGGSPGMHGPAGQGMPFNPQVFAGPFMAGEDEDVIVDVQVEVDPGEFDIGFAPGPRLGVGIGEIDAATREELGVEGSGVLLNDVFPGSAAEKAGLKEGDVVVSLDGEDVNDLAAFVELIRSRRAGDAVSLEVLRAGADEPVTIAVTLEDGPPAGGPGKSMPMSMHLDPGTMKALHERIGELDPALQAKIVGSFDDLLRTFGPEFSAQFQKELRANLAMTQPGVGAHGRIGPHVITVPGVPLTPHTPPAATSHQSTCRAICIDGDLRIEIEADSDNGEVDVEITRGDDTVFEGEVDPDGDLSEVPDQFRARARELIGQIQRNRH